MLGFTLFQVQYQWGHPPYGSMSSDISELGFWHVLAELTKAKTPPVVFVNLFEFGSWGCNRCARTNKFRTLGWHFTSMLGWPRSPSFVERLLDAKANVNAEDLFVLIQRLPKWFLFKMIGPQNGWFDTHHDQKVKNGPLMPQFWTTPCSFFGVPPRYCRIGGERLLEKDRKAFRAPFLVVASGQIRHHSVGYGEWWCEVLRGRYRTFLLGIALGFWSSTCGCTIWPFAETKVFPPNSIE